MDSDGVRTVVIATNNAHKVTEIRGALQFPGWGFVAASDLDETWPSPEEDGDTFEDNARIKARAAHERFGLAAIADDSGLEVDALGGAPGVRSSRYAGPCATDEQNNALLLANLADVPPERRRARFRCVLVLVDENGHETVAGGTCEGSIGLEHVGALGFGYDPIFFPDAARPRSMGELTLEQKDAISHRGAALRTLRAMLEGE